MKPAPRLHVLLARDAPVGLVLRRGPSHSVATFLWDRTTDTFTLGQWVRARLYEKRCHLSPDGRWLITFAFTGKQESEAGSAYTAISKAPYLKALDLYAASSGTWFGGGVFLSNTSYWLNGPGACLRADSGLHHDRAWDAEPRGNVDRGVYFPRLLQDGWTRTPAPAWASMARTPPFVVEKPLAQDWRLRLIPSDPDAYTLIDPAGGEREQPAWQWADRDGDTLVYAQGGKLFRAAPGGGAPQAIHDFSAYTFAAIEAPYS